MKNLVAAFVLGGALVGGGMAFAGKGKHPNLMAAEKDIKMAIQKLKAAQTANEYDLGGHAKKAEDFLAQAEGEVGQAMAAAEAK
jgi:hypothetical protein